MNHLLQIERLFAIPLASFEVQINTLNVLHEHRMRSEILQHTKRLVEALSKSIESIELEFINGIEGETEQMLGQSATLVKVVSEAKEEMPDMEFLDKICTVAKTSHGSLTASLSKEEQRLTQEVLQRFTVMKKRVSALLSTIEKM